VPPQGLEGFGPPLANLREGRLAPLPEAEAERHDQGQPQTYPAEINGDEHDAQSLRAGHQPTRDPPRQQVASPDVGRRDVVMVAVIVVAVLRLYSLLFPSSNLLDEICEDFSYVMPVTDCSVGAQMVATKPVRFGRFNPWQRRNLIHIILQSRRC
jgi:hypothetical protein